MPKLGVNIDHVATLRQARRESDPDPLEAARICIKAGADSIVAHLREDRRHMNDKDIFALRRIIKIRFNLEMSLNEEIVKIALKVKPDEATLVPEKREEITTEGGLDVVKHFDRVKEVTARLREKKIMVSLFIDAEKKQIMASKDAGVGMIELHTGRYDHAGTKAARQKELKKIAEMTKFACGLGLVVNAGHGLKYDNTRPIAKIPGIEELNIGHSIISRSVFVGLEQAVREMKTICNVGRRT
jgi:pyridoxine 5-phosphate synthase